MGGVIGGGWAQDPALLAAAFAANASRLPALLGSPETVVGQLREAHDVLGFGRFDLIAGSDLLPKEFSEQTIQLFGEKVIPEFQAAVGAAA